MDSRLLQRDQAEIKRSAAEAKKAILEPIPQNQIDRYLNAVAHTPFALEYAFHLLGDVRGKIVVDLGSGQGENLVALIARGARVLGIDISPDMIALTQQRLRDAELKADLLVESAYETGLADESVDAIFCVELIHHLEIRSVRDEMLRILRPGGVVILKEPIRFSKAYGRLRDWLPAQEDLSEFEHPLTREEVDTMTEPFEVQGTRYFRLPFVPLIARTLLPAKAEAAYRASDWSLRHFPVLERYATVVVTRLRKPAEHKKSRSLPA